jgi:asparagine synthase (glutamine-hydrolysing)
MEKHLIRTAFSEENYLNSQGNGLLPNEVLMRRKEAFSDGVSKTSRSLYEIIQEYTDSKFMNEDYLNYTYIPEGPDMYKKIAGMHYELVWVDDYLLPETSEQFYYRKIFEQNYPGMGEIIPYFWMPKYVKAKDASARTLEIYNNNEA